MIVDGICAVRRDVVCLLLACLPILAGGAPPRLLPQDLTVRVWNKQQGLPDDSVTSVLQPRDGYLWVGTSGGLARFDGVRFVPIMPRAGKLIGVTALCEDSAGRLWIGTQSDGLFCYVDGAVNKFHGNGAPLDETINSIAADGTGTLWLGTPSGLGRLEGAKLTRFTSSDGLPNDFVSSVHVARSGTVWITTRGGMCRFKDGQIHPFPFQTDGPGRNPESLGVYEDRRGNLWAFGDTYLVNLTEGKHLNHFGIGDATSSTRIWSLCEGRRGELWIGTSGTGLYCFTDEKFFPVSPRDGGLTSDVRAICEDREGNLWLGTHASGLLRLQPRNVRVLDANVGFPNHPAVCLAFNSQGRSWIGFERGGLYEGALETFERAGGENGSGPHNLISSICVAPDSSLWVGTPGAGLYCVANQRTIHYTTASGLSDDHILAVATDNDGAVWVGTRSGGLHRIAGGQLTSFGQNAGLPAQPVTAILPARAGGVWIGCEGGGVLRGENGKFHSVVEPDRVAGKTIRAMHEDSAGRLWLGTAGLRFACVIGDRCTRWDLTPGFYDDSVCGILSDDEGDLWLSTGKAIYRVMQSDLNALLSSQAPLRSQLFFKAEPVLNTAPACGWPRALRSPDGKLWFAMDHGVVTLDLRGQSGDPTPPPVLIEEIAINGAPFPPLPPGTAAGVANRVTPPTRLPSGLRSLGFQFTALSFSAPDKIRFRHRLDGFDPDWVVDGHATRSVQYGRLPYGVYTFRVEAGTVDEWWHEREAAFSFVVPTPIWRTGWALGGYSLAAVTLVAGAARLVSNRRLRRKLATLAAQQAMERERMRIARDMHDEIGSKLTKISFMSERAKRELHGQEPVARKLESIADTSRDLLQTLDEIVWAVNPRNDTLEHLAAYLGHYATEYLQNTAVGCELRIPGGLPHHPLSAEVRHNLFLAFEESLNNALKHGRASKISINMAAESGRFEIRIEDNGCGFDSEAVLSAAQTNGAVSGKRGGHGLRNMRQRLAVLGGQCSVRSRPHQGTTVILSMPLGAAAALQPKESET